MRGKSHRLYSHQHRHRGVIIYIYYQSVYGSICYPNTDHLSNKHTLYHLALKVVHRSCSHPNMRRSSNPHHPIRSEAGFNPALSQLSSIAKVLPCTESNELFTCLETTLTLLVGKGVIAEGELHVVVWGAVQPTKRVWKQRNVSRGGKSAQDRLDRLYSPFLRLVRKDGRCVIVTRGRLVEESDRVSALWLRRRHCGSGNSSCRRR